ncbi:holo-ACP synthase [uncultured Treponema sp.]|uniref:holo-ACP synthase n=1 Tax=uncultured Treponema sp. TaxID=162155 RepID=UPI0015BE64AE|nr:holo-ACP synthase [uncultured Treponema sp.]
MIYGIGTDICEIHRFERWLKKPEMFLRFFNAEEQPAFSDTVPSGTVCRHYAARFAAKEAFSKALGTGLTGFSLKDFYVAKDEMGKPFFVFGEETEKILEERTGKNSKVHLSLSHEKDYALAFVVIESE